MGGLALDERQQAVEQVGRRHEEMAEAGAWRVGRAGQLVEQRVHVLRDPRVGGKQAEIGVHAGGVGVVIAGPDVRVAPHPAADPPPPAHDERELRVRLQAHEARHDVDAVPLEAARPLDIPGLVEPGLHLHQHRDVLAAGGGAAERVPDGRRSAGPVQRELDGRHVGVGRRLRHEPLEAAGEGVVGVMHQNVALVELLRQRARGGERLPRSERRVVGHREGRGNLQQTPQVERPLRLVDVGRRQRALTFALFEAQLPLQQLLQGRRRACFDLDAHHRPQLPAGELLLDGLQEVGGGCLVELEIAAARDAKGVSGHDFAVRVEEVQGGAHQVLDGEEAPPIVERDEARERLRHLDVRVVHGASSPGVVAQGDQHGNAAVAHQGKWVTGRARQGLGGQERKESVGAPLPQARLIGGTELRPPRDANAPGVQLVVAQRAEGAVLPGEQGAQAHGDRIERLLGPQAVRRRARPPQSDELLQRPHLRHDELVEVGGEDREEAQARRRRRARVLGEGEHPPVEFEPRKLGVEELLGRRALGIPRCVGECGCSKLAQRHPAGTGDRIRRGVLGGITERAAGPLGDERRARRDGERRERAGIAQHG